MPQNLGDLAAHLAAAFPGDVLASSVRLGELAVELRPDNLVAVATFLRDDPKCLFKMLVDVCGVDYPQRPHRFDVVYNLVSLKLNQRIRLKIAADEDVPVPSVVGVWSAAAWFEREAWDLYGILFAGNPDLRRLLTDYGFEGHPLRKDFPLTGFVEVRWDEEQKRVVYEKVKLKQEFRSFDFISPWEGMTRVLPGDEKAKGEGQ